MKNRHNVITRAFVALGFLWLLTVQHCWGAEWTELLPVGKPFLELRPDALAIPERAPFFRWLAVDKQEEAHYPGYQNSPPLTFLGLPVVEANIRFQNNTLESAHLSLFNRGDNGRLNKSSFDVLLTRCQETLSTWTGGKGTPGSATRISNEAKVQSRAWNRDGVALLLSWSSSGHGRELQGEFVQLQLTPMSPLQSELKPAQGAKPPLAVGGKASSGKQISANIVRRQSDVFIDNLPMVDQGAKGYCAVATTERVLRYYGLEVNQHLIAQLADSTTAGTNPVQMFQVLNKASAKFGVLVREHYQAIETMSDLTRLLNTYNTWAKRQRKPQVSLPAQRAIDLDGLFSAFDPELYRSSRLEGARADYRRYLADIKTHIDKGIPLLWSVRLGIVPEHDLPQTRSGHMRLIIGYTCAESGDTMEKVIYSDSWGAGHEFKKMSVADAWTITMGLYSFDPRR